MSHFLAVDLGGTKTGVSVGDEHGNLTVSHRMPTEADTPPERWLERLDVLIGRVLGESKLSLSDIAAVGVATPGPMSVRTGTVIAPPNMPTWRNVPVRLWIEKLTGRPTFINNDANGAGLAEYRFGEFKHTPDLVYMTMSTGIGGGVISGGRLLQGADDLAGELGHFVLDPNGPPCTCGHRGCLEMYCGGRNLILHVQGLLASGTASLILDEAGGKIEDITVSAIARAAFRGDPMAQEIWDRFIERLAQGVGIVLMCFNPSVIVMGTIAIHLGDQLLEPLRAQLPRFAYPQSLANLQIKPSALGTKIGDLGALAIAISGHSESTHRPTV
jgi:glucokinase